MTLRDHKYTAAGNKWISLSMGVAANLSWGPMRLFRTFESAGSV